MAVQQDRRQESTDPIFIRRDNNRVGVLPINLVPPEQRLLPRQSVFRNRIANSTTKRRLVCISHLIAKVVVVILVPAFEEVVLWVSMHVKRATSEVGNLFPLLVSLYDRISRMLRWRVLTPCHIFDDRH